MKHRKQGTRTSRTKRATEPTPDTTPALFSDLVPRGYVRVRSYVRRKPTTTKRKKR